MTKLLVTVFVAVLLATPAGAAQCRGDFNGFLAAIARDAQAQGISRAVINSAFAGVSIDPAVLAFDRRQHGTSPATTVRSPLISLVALFLFL